MKSINSSASSIRTFIGAKNYIESRKFYSELGFEESVIDDKMSYFRVNAKLGFYLQDYYVKKWCDNSMVLLEIEDAQKCFLELKASGVEDRYEHVRISEIKSNEHGHEIFVHDPCGVLWHFFQFLG